MRVTPGLIVLVLTLSLPATAGAAPPERVPILFDTDFGSDVDEGLALALILGSPELDLRGVTTVSGDTNARALMVCRFLTMTGRRHTPVASGATPQPPAEIKELFQYYYHPDVLFNRTTRPVKESAVEFLNARVKGQQGKVTILATGPLTNIARLLIEHPESKAGIKRIVLLGRSPHITDIKPFGPESNIWADVTAAQAVFRSGVPLLFVPDDSTIGLTIDEAGLNRIFAPVSALSVQVQCLHQLSDLPKQELAAALATALCFDERHCKMEEMCLEVDVKGVVRKAKGKANARVVVSTDHDAFRKWYVDRMAALLPPVKAPSKLVERGNMPTKVHVAEDYDLDIERRWWMSGKAETKNLPPNSTRACRGVLTHDFDDLLGNAKAMYTAVIFNPVPGPPMGPNTRLTFKYWLKGTSTLRVQIYSLTNGYHRHLVLTDLPQEKWQSGTVDMTQCRRPDGTGGPLSEDERIDDIQFYTDPTAELIIDDIVLYDAATKDEKRPFPAKIHFTGLFDTGKQGKEWPGDFEIVPHTPPRTWKAAKSVMNPDSKLQWLRIGLRGERPMGETTHLSFRYQLSGANSLRVALVNRAKGDSYTVELKDLKKEAWGETTVDFSGAKRGDSSTGAPPKGTPIDEIHILSPSGAELLVDDVLLYEPGK